MNERLSRFDAQRTNQGRKRLKEMGAPAWDNDVQVTRMDLPGPVDRNPYGPLRSRSAPGGAALAAAAAGGGGMSQQGHALVALLAEERRLLTLRAFFQRYCGFLRLPLSMLMELHGWIFRRVAVGRDVSPEETIEGIQFNLADLLPDMPVTTALRLCALEGVTAGVVTAEHVERWLSPGVCTGRLADAPDSGLIATDNFCAMLLRVVEVGSHLGLINVGAAAGDGPGSPAPDAVSAARPASFATPLRLMLHVCFQRVSAAAAEDGSAARLKAEGRTIPADLLEWVPIELRTEADIRGYWDGLKAAFVDQSGAMDEAFPAMLVPEVRPPTDSLSLSQRELTDPEPSRSRSLFKAAQALSPFSLHPTCLGMPTRWH